MPEQVLEYFLAYFQEWNVHGYRDLLSLFGKDNGVAILWTSGTIGEA